MLTEISPPRANASRLYEGGRGLISASVWRNIAFTNIQAKERKNTGQERAPWSVQTKTKGEVCIDYCRCQKVGDLKTDV